MKRQGVEGGRLRETEAVVGIELGSLVEEVMVLARLRAKVSSVREM